MFGHDELEPQPAPALPPRVEKLRLALGGAPGAPRYFQERLEEERRATRYLPGMSFEESAWGAGRVAVLAEMVDMLRIIMEN